MVIVLRREKIEDQLGINNLTLLKANYGSVANKIVIKPSLV
jgi:hypothetical protein